MAAMSIAKLLKYNWRISIFLRIYENEEPVMLNDGTSVVFKYNKKVARWIERKIQARLRGEIFFSEDTNKMYKIADIKKTLVFGGEEAGTTFKEDMELKSLNAQIQQAKEKNSIGLLPIKIGPVIYEVHAAVTTTGTPKSDFHLVDANNKPIVWISHKDGHRPTDFQQWGGMSAPTIKNNSEVKRFIKDVKKLFPDGLEPGTSIGRRITNRAVKLKSVYGVNYGQKHGEQNVTLLLQGPVKLQKFGEHFILKSNNTHKNGESLKREFEPTLTAIYKNQNQFGVKNARFVIYPAGGRKIKEI